MKYPVAPPERIYLSALGERVKNACLSKRTEFKYLKIDVCVSTRPRPKGVDSLQIRESKDVVEIVQKLAPELVDAMAESVGIVCLNSRNEVVGFAVPFSGGVASAPVEVATLLKLPLLVPSCSGFILFHNHPSGTSTPSQDDVTLTGRVAEAARLVGLRFLDHVILASNGSTSFMERGLMPRG